MVTDGSKTIGNAMICPTMRSEATFCRAAAMLLTPFAYGKSSGLCSLSNSEHSHACRTGRITQTSGGSNLVELMRCSGLTNAVVKPGMSPLAASTLCTPGVLSMPNIWPLSPVPAITWQVCLGGVRGDQIPEHDGREVNWGLLQQFDAHPDLAGDGGHRCVDEGVTDVDVGDFDVVGGLYRGGDALRGRRQIHRGGFRWCSCRRTPAEDARPAHSHRPNTWAATQTRRRNPRGRCLSIP